MEGVATGPAQPGVLLAVVRERGHSGGRNELFLVLQVISQDAQNWQNQAETQISVFGQRCPGFCGL